MKILFLHLTMGLVERGSEISTDIIATALAKDHEVLVIQSGPQKPKPYHVKRIYPLGVAPPAAPTSLIAKLSFRLGLDLESQTVIRFTRAAISLIQSFKPDIIVATNGAPQLAILQACLRRQGLALQAKLVVFGRAGIGHHDEANLRAKPDLFIALTPQAESWARQITSKFTKIVYIPNPISPVGANPCIRPCNLSRPIVLCVGALSAYKNISSVIEAIRQTQCSYLLVGDGEERDTTQQLLSTLGNDFRWIKHLESSELAAYYAAADVFCFVPDPQEAFGRVYLEAMAAGLPIVASDDPIRRELIGPLGIYVDPHNPSEIVSGITQATQLGRLDYTAQLKPYLLQRVIKQIEKEFYDLIH